MRIAKIRALRASLQFIAKLLLIPALLAGPAANAATDISNAPLFTSSASAVKPNLMFILDDSGSMGWDFLPDNANFSTTKYGKLSYQCNGVAYNPAISYTLPVDATGTAAAPASLSFITPDPATQTTNHRSLSAIAAMPTTTSGTLSFTIPTNTGNAGGWYTAGGLVTIYQSSTQYFVGTVSSWSANSTSGTLVINMAGGTIVGSGSMATPTIGNGQPGATYYKYTGTQPNLGYTYTSSGVITSTTFYKECNSLIGSTPGSAVFTPVNVTSFSAEAQNYANWSQYYRTRMTMMKSSISLAFKTLDSRYRVGYSTIQETTAVQGTDFLNIRDFDATQKSAFYTAFNAATPGNSTPLRGALAKAGQYFANKARSQTVDPVQYSCQRNFTILSTDGYWNTGNEVTTSPKYGPYKADNITNVGQQDGSPTLAPMLDGGGSSDSLADVAAYYYNTDLRNTSLSNCTGALGTDVCKDNVSPVKGDAAHSYGDSAIWQHMTTFTLGLGVSGLLNYTPDYLTKSSGDFFEITNGNKNWPVPGGSKGPENVDDLWHAAVDGRGQYFSAGNPNTLATSLNTALNSLGAITGAAAAASTSSLQPVQGDNDIYVAKFRSVEWTGDLQAFQILSNATITTVPTWSAQTQLGLQSAASRTIYYPSGSALKAFTYANLTADALNTAFDNFCSKPSAGGAAAPSQCGGLDPTTLTQANSGANLVSYLRGDQTLTYYRSRAAVLGDIINASPLFVGKPNFKYLDSTYDAFKTAQASRTAVVLAAANDGMLHAFDRVTGNERWAYIPSFVLPNLYKLADQSYSTNHSYFVDGSPQMGDIFVGGAWKTIVVGGLGAGGRGYYALDVTDPATPKLLWEFSDPQLGLSFGNPIITKRADGTWVVVFASGYNNNVGAGDGNGHLFVLDANTGLPVNNHAATPTPLAIATFTSGTTPAGTAAQPSGLAKLNAWIDSDTNNTARRFYGGDLLGNLWRFDIDDQVAPNEKALLLGSMKLSDGTPQPVTVKPALAEIEYPTASGTKYPVVFVATGEYLGVTDLATTTQQSIYAIKDPLLDASWGNLRTNSLVVTQTLTVGAGGVRTVTSNPVNWTSQAGWRVDLPDPGERVNVNPQLVLNTLTVGSNEPSSDACTIGGSSFLYKFDIATGSTAAGESSVGTFLGSVLVEGLTTVQLGSTSGSPGSIITIVTRSDATLETSTSSPTGFAGSLRRTSWRELVD